MSFAYKKLNPADIKSVPYTANKQYEYDSSSYSSNNIQTYVGEYIPITTDQPFDPVNDNLTTDENYRRLIYESIRHLYYQNYVTKSSADQETESADLLYPDNVNTFWHSSSYDNYLQNTLSSGSFPNYRNFPYFQQREFDYDASGSALYGSAIYFIENAAKIRVISVPKDKYGEGIKPNSFIISGSNYYISDDGQGNLFDFIKVIQSYGDQFYSAPAGYYAGKADGLVTPVGNVFYNHGLAVITNQDYLCFIEGSPVARNDYYTILNTQEEKVLNILNADFDDCVSIASESVLTSNITDFTFPDYSVSGSGDITITPNYNSTIPGQYKLQYTVDNTLGITSNTASVTLNITAQPLTSSISSVTQSCFDSNISSSITFSIDKGLPPYSWSIDNSTYTPISDLFQPIVTASLLPTRSLVLYVKDNNNEIVTQSINTSYIPINGKVWGNNVPSCETNSGSIIVSASGASGIISASLTASFSNSVELPTEFTGLITGSYNIYFKDSNLCTSSSTILLEKVKPVTASYTITHVECFSSNSGKIILDELDSNLSASDTFLTGGNQPLTWSWSGPNGFSSASQNIINVPSGSYILNIFDSDGCANVFNYDITSSTEITYTASINYSASDETRMDVLNLTGGIPPYSYEISTSLSLYTGSLNSGSYTINLSAEGLSSGSASIQIFDSQNCYPTSKSVEIYGRIWEVSESFCEDGTGSVAARNLNFYTYEPTGSEWVTVRIHSGSETPIEIATSGSATGSYIWNHNSTLYIDVYTGSNDNFYLRREYSGSSEIINPDNTSSRIPANLTGSEVTNSALITGSGRMDYFYENVDVSLTFGTSHSISSLHLTASKINTEDLTTNINFKFDKQIDLNVIRDNFTGSVSNLITTGSDGSGSNFVARDNEFIDTIYGNTGSFIGPNTLLFREDYSFGNIINTPSGSNVDYTSGSIWSGSISASYFGGTNAQYFTQRTDKVWLMTADVDNISFIEAYSYTDLDQYQNDPIGVRQNTTGSHRNYNIFAGSQRMENDLMYIMIIHEDEFANMSLPSGFGGGEIFNRKLNLIRDVNRVYYLFMSPNTGTSFVNNYSASYNVTIEADNEFTNSYYIDGIQQPTIELRRNTSASLVQTSGTNVGHPIRLSTTADGTHNGGSEYTGSNNGVIYVGTPGTGSVSASLTINLPEDAPDTLYYYCQSHSLMGGQINVYDSSSIIQSDLDNRALAIGQYFIDNVIYG